MMLMIAPVYLTPMLIIISDWIEEFGRAGNGDDSLEI